MATPNVGILTTAGKALIDKVNSGQAKISFSKVVFSSMDNSQLSDTQVKALITISPQEVVVSPPETTLDTTSGETRIRATGTNKQLADGVYVKTYGVFAKDDTGNEVLYGVTVSPNPNYFPAYDGVTPQAVTYSYKTVIQETSNIIMTNSNDVYVTQEDLTEAIGKIPQPDLSNYATKDQLATKADTSSIDPSVLAKSTLTADDDVLALDAGTYYTWGVKPHNFPALVSWSTVVVKAVGNQPIDGKSVTITDTNASQLVNTYSGSASTGKWSGWKVPNSTTMASKTDMTTAISTATDNMVDSSKPTNFTAGLQSGGVNVATAAELKSIEDSAWRELDKSYLMPDKGSLDNQSSFLFKLDTTANRLYFIFKLGISEAEVSAKGTKVSVDLSSVVKNISTPTLTGFSNYYWLFGTEKTISISNNLLQAPSVSTFCTTSYSSYKNGSNTTIFDTCFVSYDELV